MLIDYPLRLAVGSHFAGSGKGCAMNVISWENGDSTITDYPGCTHRVLARLVQSVNDNMCTHRDAASLLCPKCSVMVLELAHRTVGTAGAMREQVWAWLAELLDSPDWGVVRHARPVGVAAIRSAADLCRRAAAGDMAPAEVWQKARDAAADAAAYAAADAAYAADAAAYAAADAADAAYAYAADAAYAAADAVGVAKARLEHAHQAIDAWERITGTSAPEPNPTLVRDAYARMTA